ncbi:unnamed protein product [Euphydryas editha]|uniref:Uncharacterized protein n=1 Tax=Euphydryas editha TaxID=104508 RepID=A0AAU9TDQ4_EUPED|nr:unnamed protein product [Euphydryas editha]
MTRNIVICILLNQMLAASAWRSGPGRFTYQSYSEPLFRTASWSPRRPFLAVKPFLNLFINEPPPKPCPDTYTPEPFELTDKTSKILHKVHTVTEDYEQMTKDYEKIEDTIITESSDEELPPEYDNHEVEYCNNAEIDIRDSEDISCGDEEEDDEETSEDNDTSDEQHENDRKSTIDIEIIIRSI